MALSPAGADRFLNALLGANTVAAVASPTVRLHTTAEPAIANELSGNGYSRATVAPGNFSVSTVSGYVRIAFPAMSFFTDATSQAQTAESLALWHGTDLIWHRDTEIIPRHAAVAAAANAVYMEFQLDGNGMELVDAAVRTAAQTLVGAAFTNPAMFWELHTGSPPTSANRVTDGGLDGIAENAWGFSTPGNGFRRARSAALNFGSVNAAVDAPAAMGLWRGRPESAGVLHAYRDISPADFVDGATITIGANQLYVGVQLEGSNV